MKKIILTFIIGLMTMVGYGQQFYPFEKNDITYFGMNSIPKLLLNHLGVYYASPSDRLIASDSLSKIYMEHFRWDEDKILIVFEKHKQQHTDSSFTLNVDVNRVIMSRKEFFEQNEWNDEFSRDCNEMMAYAGSLIIGMKEWSIPKNTKPFIVESYITLDLRMFKSVLVIETYLPGSNQVSTVLFLRTQDGKLIDGDCDLVHIKSTYAKK